jgi:uncharacterized protein
MSADFNYLYLTLPLFGFLIGLFVTMFGGGGGFFYVPLLTILFHIPIQVAIATSLASIIPTVIVGSCSHYTRGNVDLPTGLAFGIAGIAGALAGSFISTLIPPPALKRLFGIAMILLVLPIVFRTIKKNDADHPREPRPVPNRRRMSVGVSFGLLSGIMSGLFGVSGTAPVISGLYLLHLPVQTVIGTSVFVLLFNAFSGLFGHLAFGHIDLTLILLLGGGAALGSCIGPKLLGRIKNDLLERIYGVLFVVFVVVVGLLMTVR